MTVAAGPALGPWEREIEGLAALVRGFTVTITARGGASHGCGIVWHENGLIATNAHVVTADRLSVALPDGRELEARLLARDRRRDLALLSLEARDLREAPRGDASTLRAGSLVFAAGHPWGVAHALSLGVVHGVVRNARGAPRWIAADVRLAPGNSGGPLVDAGGRVVGVNAMIVNGLGAAIPVNVVAAFVRATTGHGADRRSGSRAA
jgi:serine protease Do